MEGAAGIGKTRLLGAVQAAARERGFTVLSATGSDLERDYCYGLVRQLFEPVVRDDGDALAGRAGMARPLFDAPAAGAPPIPSEAVLYGLQRLVAGLASRRPLLLSVDDAHWADSHSLFFLNYLSRRLASSPVALVVSTRRGGDERELLGRFAAVVEPLSLRPLSAAGTAALVRALLDGATDELCGACHAASGGNPFLVHELAVSVRADGLGPEAFERVQRLVPSAVRRHVLVRLSHAGPDAVDVARAVAILGPGSRLHDAGELAGLGGTSASKAFDRLVSADVLAPALPPKFVHSLVREAVYLDLSPAARDRAYARAARLVAAGQGSAERVAGQLLACEPEGSEWAARALRNAAQRAFSRGAPQASARYLERAVAEPPPPELLGPMLGELGVAESRAGLPDARRHLAAALEHARDPVERAAIAQELAALDNLLGNFTEAAALLDGVISELGQEHEELRLSLGAEAVVVAVAALGARARLAPRMRDLRVRAGPLADNPAAAPLLAVLATELSETDGTAAASARLAERAVADDRLYLRPGPLLAIGVSALISADHLARAEAILSAAIAAAESDASLHLVRSALPTRARAYLRSGQIAAAEVDARQALELPPHHGPERPHFVAQLADALIEQDRSDEAEALVGPEELALHDPDSILFQPLRATRARILSMRGRPLEALELLEQQGRWAEAWGCRNAGWVSWRASAALLYRATGRPDRARALAEQDLEAAQAFGAPRPLGVALRTAGLVDGERTIELLSDSVDALDGHETRPQLAYSLVELGAGLRRGGERRAARSPLRKGLQLADECNMALLAKRARAELAASGARARRTHETGVAALTPSERRVAKLAAEGHANRQIAQALFLSPKTVEMHLGHTYRKLEIHSRTELSGALRDLEDDERVGVS